MIRSVVLFLLLLGGSRERAQAQGTAFTYQGALSENGAPVNGTNDLTFTLFDAASGGATVGASNVVDDLVISNGLFTRLLNFGDGVFNGNARWLEIGVRPGGSVGPYTALAPRQLITPTPYAVTAGNLTGTVPANGLAGTYGGAVTLSNPANVLVGNGSGLTGLDAGNVATGTLSDNRLSLNVARLDGSPTFAGTVTSLADLAGARLNVGTGNTLGGNFSSIAGGQSNVVTDYAFAAGRRAQAIDQGAFVWADSQDADFNSTTSNQFNVRASGGARFETGGGGMTLDDQIVLAGFVPGWALSGPYSEGVALTNIGNSFAGSFSGNGAALTALNAANLTTGRMADARLSTNVALLNARQIFTGTNVFTSTNAGSPLTITNATDNAVAIDFRQRFYRWRLGQNRPPDSPTTPDAFFIVGDDLSLSPHTRLLIDTFGRVGIGTAAPESRLHVAGTITAGGDLVGQRLMVGETNLLTGTNSTIGGGRFNTNLSASATVAGGSNNTLQTNADNSAIGGGEWNTILTNGHHASLSGGQSNTLLGFYAIIPGGQLNQATNYAFAAGRRAQASHQGAFVWADSQDADFSSTGNNQFNVRASGGARFVTGGGGVTLDGQNVLAGTVPGSALSGTYSNALAFNNPANTLVGSFTGNGGGVTNLNATNLSSGTLPGARLAGTYSSALTLNNAANAFVGSYSGNGAGLTNLNVPGLLTNVALLNTNQTFTGANTFTNAANTFVGSFTGNGAGVTNLNATNLASGTVPSARLSGTYAGALTLNNASNTFVGIYSGNGAGLTNLSFQIAPTNVALLNTNQTFAGANTFTNAANNFVGSFTGNGAAVTNLNATNLASGIVPSARLSGTYASALTLNNAANRFTGNGAGLTALNASSLISGTVADARLSANVALLDAGQTFTGTNTFSNPANVFVGSHTGNGAGLTNLNVPSVPTNVALLNTNQTFAGANTFTNAANAFVGSFTGNGAGVTNLNATNLLSGTVPGARLSGTYANALTLNNAANTFVGSYTGNGAGLTNLSFQIAPTNVALLNTNQTFAGANTFTNAANSFVGSFTGDGAGVANLNAANLSSGTVPSARLSGTYSGALTLNNAANRFTGNGAGLAALNASSLSSGTVADARLSANVALLDTGQTFTGTNTFSNPANIFVGSYTGNGVGLTNLNVPSVPTNVALLNTNQTFTGGNTFNNPANSFRGNGAALTSLNASSLSSGTVADARLSTNVALLDAGQTFTGTNTFTNAANTFVGSYTGNGAGLTNLNVPNVPTNVALLNTNQTFTGGNTFNNPANSFRGNGAALTSLNASSLSSGTVADARLSTNLAFLNASQTFAGTNTFTNAANTFVGSYTGNGAGLTNLNVPSVPTNVALLNTNQTFTGANTFTNAANSFVGSYTGDGAGVTNLNAANLSNGTVPSARLSGTYAGALTLNNAANTFAGSFTGNGAGLTNLNVPSVPTNVALLNANQTFTGANTFTNAANSFVGSYTGDGAGVANLNAANLSSGTVPSARLSGTYASALTLNNAANRFTGNGAGLTSLSATNLSSGTVADERLSANVPLLDASQIFASTNTFTNPANSFAGNGAALTSLNASSLSGGTVADARLSTNIAFLNASQAFSGTNTFTNAANIFVGSYTGNGAGVTNLNAANLLSGTVPSARLSGTFASVLTLNNAANTFVGSFTGNGAGLTNLNVPSVPTNAALLNTNQTFTGANTFTNAANSFVGSYTGDGAGLTHVAGTFPLQDVGDFNNNSAADVSTLKFHGGLQIDDSSSQTHIASADETHTFILGPVGDGSGLTNLIGDGSRLTGLSAANLSSGTISDARLSANVALLGASQIFTSTNTFTHGSNVFVGRYTGDGAAVANLNAANLSSGTVPSARLSGTYASALTLNNAANRFTGNGAALTSLSAANLSSGTVSDARLSANVALLGASQIFTSTNIFTNAANIFVGSYTGDGAAVANLNAANLSSGTVPSARLSGTYASALTLNNAANRFTGNGAALTSLSAANLSSGTVADARLSANVALLDASQDFTGTNTFPNAANSFAGNGAGLTALNASSLSSGTVADARLSTNLAFLNSSQTFTGTNTFTNAANSFVGRFQPVGPLSSPAGFTGNLLRTPDNTPLELKIDGTLALRLEPTASGYPNVIGGLSNNVITPGTVGATISGGYSNTVGGQTPIVGGGSGNTANGLYATIPGGTRNGATNYAFAAGRRAQAMHDGAFVWGDATDADMVSTNANSVTLRASGGYRFFSNPNATAGVSLAMDGTAWETISDRMSKKNFQPVDVRAVLEKLALVPVQRWNYKWESDAAVPHLGPMAQDFKSAFYPGRDDKVITTQEIDGVALAAIQGVNQKVEEQAGALRRRSAREIVADAKAQELGERISRAEAEIQELEQTVSELKQLVNSLTHKLNGGAK